MISAQKLLSAIALLLAISLQGEASGKLGQYCKKNDDCHSNQLTCHYGGNICVWKKCNHYKKKGSSKYIARKNSSHCCKKFRNKSKKSGVPKCSKKGGNGGGGPNLKQPGPGTSAKGYSGGNCQKSLSIEMVKKVNGNSWKKTNFAGKMAASINGGGNMRAPVSPVTFKFKPCESGKYVIINWSARPKSCAGDACNDFFLSVTGASSASGVSGGFHKAMAAQGNNGYNNYIPKCNYNIPGKGHGSFPATVYNMQAGKEVEIKIGGRSANCYIWKIVIEKYNNQKC